MPCALVGLLGVDVERHLRVVLGKRVAGVGGQPDLEAQFAASAGASRSGSVRSDESVPAYSGVPPHVTVQASES